MFFTKIQFFYKCYLKLALILKTKFIVIKIVILVIIILLSSDYSKRPKSSLGEQKTKQDLGAATPKPRVCQDLNQLQ